MVILVLNCGSSSIKYQVIDMEAVTLRHVDKSYTTYGTEVVLTG